MTLRKQILFYSLLLLLTLAAVEGMARSAYYLAYGEWYRVPPPPTISSAGDAGPNPGGGDRENQTLRRGSLGWLINHPYYGYTSPLPTDDLNAMPPPQIRADRVVIGVLGGSVADEVTPFFRRAVEQYFADNALVKEPVIHSLSELAMQQPQQLGIANHLLAMGGSFDILVNLDGFNELATPYLNFRRGVFPFFPKHWNVLNHWTTAEIALVGEIRLLRGEVAALRQAGPSSPLRYSAAYGLVNRYRTQRLADRIFQLNYELTTTESGYSLESRGPSGNFGTVAEVHQEAVRVWYRSSAILSLLADGAGSEYYHFLQPNQYLPDAKPLSAEELELYIDPETAAASNYAQTYPLLVKFGKELQQRGINYFDLTRIYRDHPETLYRDVCCHLNARGNELLAAAMVQRLAPALRRRGQDTAAVPADSILAVAAPRPALLRTPTPAPPVPLLQGAAAAQPEFQVYRRQPANVLEYAKDPCGPEHTAAWFFLHITPVSVADLPARRREHGFVNQDFRFRQSGGIRYYDQCSIYRPLPDYPIARIRTGQYNAAGQIWAVELSFAE